jgi:hypothetical protein
MILPNRIFFTGVPGSKWSGIAQVLESLEGFNISDRTPERDYTHSQYSGHKGAYFGRGMEFDHSLEARNIDAAHSNHDGTRIIKSHDWAYALDQIEHYYPDDWIMLVYRPDMTSYAWWHEAGGFNIKYPCYDDYMDSTRMLAEITSQNKHILEYAYTRNATWNYFTEQWIEDNFGQKVGLTKSYPDILVALIK